MVNLDKCFQRYALWTERLAHVKPHYAIKANNDPMILKVYAHLGTGFDCASKGELEQMLGLGVSPDRIIYANTIKDIKSLRYARQMDVKRMTFDNELELYKIKEHHPDATVLLRIKVDDSSATWSLSEKFGATTNTAHKLVRLAFELNVRLIGIAFHMGCSNLKPNFREEIRRARELFDFAREKFGIEMYTLDLGGSYTGLESQDHIFRRTAEHISRALDEYFPADLLKTRELVLMAEPGRFLSECVLTLCTKIVGKCIIDEQTERKQAGQSLPDTNIDSSKSMMYYLNCGFYTAFMYIDPTNTPILLKANKDERGNNVDGKLFLSTLWGPTCDSLDVVIKNRFLPEYRVEDVLVFENMGAYTNTIVTGFNSLPVPSFVYAGFDLYDKYKQAFE